jgi:hypothetical protein
MVRRFLLVTFLVGLGAATPGIATAQPRRPTPAQMRDAARIYQEGLALMESGSPEAALPKFQQAYDLAAPPNALFNMGACHEAMRNHERALEYYERYLVEAPNADDRRDVQTRISTIRAVRSRLTISSEPIGAQIFLDSGETAVGTTDQELEVTAGTHVITLRLTGYQEATKTVTLLIGESKALPFALRVIPTTTSNGGGRDPIVIEREGPTRTIIVTRTIQARERETPWYADLGLGFYKGFMTGVGKFALNFNAALAVGRGIRLADRLTLDLGLAVILTGVGGNSDSDTILLPGFRAQPRLRFGLSENVDLALTGGFGLQLAIGADQCDPHLDRCQHPILAAAATDTASLLGFEFGVAGRYMLESGLGFGASLGMDYILKSTLAGGPPLFKANLLRVIGSLGLSYRF